IHHQALVAFAGPIPFEHGELRMMDCVRILALATETAKTGKLAYRGAESDPFAGPERIGVAEEFERHAGIDLLASVAADGST
ncbi:EF-P lysine aminoacylase GenX, partial [Rhizobium ruizarguesonis]